ncbi:hypothetical protein [Phaeobacter sp. 11ANDIMAR09]|uniref:hypothetical protein n=1 Tax=Phaeobacter sp. 11ANDIMAR09 TaxID=1225647 RepID=UPI000A45755E|nr:hypothetical protein [Phaeobacter sp. 11ANDIMAR09]
MQFKSLAENGVIKPRIQVATINSPWRISDGIALVEELLGIAQPVAPTNTNGEGIQQAKSAQVCGLGRSSKPCEMVNFSSGTTLTLKAMLGSVF